MLARDGGYNRITYTKDGRLSHSTNTNTNTQSDELILIPEEKHHVLILAPIHFLQVLNLTSLQKVKGSDNARRCKNPANKKSDKLKNMTSLH